MKKYKLFFFGLVFLFLTFTVHSAEDSFKLISPNYFNEQDKIYDYIHYLENELISFNFCPEKTPQDISFNLKCENSDQQRNIEVISDSQNENCYFSNYNLDKLSCDDFSLEIDYSIDNKNKKIKRIFKQQKQSKLINHILGRDTGFLDAEELSYYLIVSNEISSRDSKESIQAYDKLKNLRDNSKKCWPSSSCDLLLTSQILRNIKLAGYEKNTRLLEDGKIYIEKNIISNENSPLKFSITIDHAFNSTEEIECDLIIDDDDEKTYTFDDNDSVIQNKYASNQIIFTCDKKVDEIEFELYNLDGQIQEIETYDDAKTFTYNIEEFACVSLSSTCDFETNINSLITYDKNIESYNQLLIYVDSNKIEGNEVEYIHSDDIIEDTGKYIYFKSNENFENYIKFNQNNDGSWGSNSRNDKIIETAWSILGLDKRYKSSEHVSDGKSWIYFNEPEEGWNSLRKNTLAYLAIKEQIKPYLKINSKNKITKDSIFIIENPTIFELKNVKVIFDEKTREHLSYTENLGDIEAEEKIRFNVSVNPTFYGIETGEMKITGIDAKNNELELLKIPINIEGPPAFDLKVEKNYSLSEDDPNVKIQLIKNLDSFEAICKFENPFTKNNEEITINQKSEYLAIPNPNLLNKSFKTNIKCSFEKNNFEISVESEVFIAETSFEILDSVVYVSSENDFSIEIHSLLDDKQRITMEITGNFKDLIIPVEKSKIIAADDTRELFFSIANYKVLKSLQDLGTGEILINSETGFSKTVPIELNFKNEDEESSYILYFIISFLVILLMSVLAYRAIKIRKENLKEENTPNENSQYHDDEYIYDEDISFE